jgi:5-methyltetrahydrofolate--homocysteine methyltransferase
VTAANEHRYDRDILDTLAQRVVVGGGAMGTQLQAADLSLDDFNNRRRRGRDEIHSAAFLVNLAKDIADKIREVAVKATAIAKRIGSSWASRRRVTT